MTFLPKLMKDEIIIIVARLNNSVKIGTALLITLHSVLLYFIGFNLKMSASYIDHQTLFYFLIFKTPIVYICILIGIANMLTYPNLSSYILTNKRIIFHYGCLFTMLVKTLFKRSPSILLSQIKEIKKDHQGRDIIYYSPYYQDNIIQKTLLLSVIEEPDTFINKLNENIESYKSTNETSREDIDYIKRYACLFGKTKSKNF